MESLRGQAERKAEFVKRVDGIGGRGSNGFNYPVFWWKSAVCAEAKRFPRTAPFVFVRQKRLGPLDPFRRTQCVSGPTGRSSNWIESIDQSTADRIACSFFHDIASPLLTRVSAAALFRIYAW